MPKKRPDEINHGFLPGIDQDPTLSRKGKLLMWMRQRGWTYAALAKAWDCHWTFPGKCLDAESEELPAERRQWLIEHGFPEELLPPYWTERQKKLHNKYRAQRKRQSRINTAAQAYLERRKKKQGGGN